MVTITEHVRMQQVDSSNEFSQSPNVAHNKVCVDHPSDARIPCVWSPGYNLHGTCRGLLLGASMSSRMTDRHPSGGVPRSLSVRRCCDNESFRILYGSASCHAWAFGACCRYPCKAPPLTTTTASTFTIQRRTLLAHDQPCVDEK